MDRIETYVGQSILEWNFSKSDQNNMVALGKVIASLFGMGTVVSGLACAQQSVANMTVNLAAGEIYQQAQLEATACGTLPADTTHQISKQGIQLDGLVVPNAATGITAFVAPGTTGQSINYLIQAAYADLDVSVDPTTGASPVVLPFFNAANSQAPLQGPGGTGATSNTFRKGIVNVQVKAGTAAATGSQATPAPDSGFVGLWVVTVAFGQTTITNSNIAQYAAAPVLPSSILSSIQNGNLAYGVDVGSVNVIQAVYPIPPTGLADNQPFWVKIKTTSTGAVTFTPNPGVIAPAPVVGAAQVALQGGEFVANGRALLVWRADITSYVLIECTGGALQVGPATQSSHAAQFGQLPGLVGTSRNLKASVAAASASITFTADQIVVASALNGLQYLLPSLNKTLNTAGTGLNGMGTGLAPVSGYVAVYAVYNPTTGVSGLLGVDSTSIVAPEICAGVMPVGFTASALISVWPTNASRQFQIGYQKERSVTTTMVIVLGTSAIAATPTSLNIASAVPPNAVLCKGRLNLSSTLSSTISMTLSSDAAAILGYNPFNVFANSTNTGSPFNALPIITSQVIFYSDSNSAGTPTFNIGITGYDF